MPPVREQPPARAGMLAKAARRLRAMTTGYGALLARSGLRRVAFKDADAWRAADCLRPSVAMIARAGLVAAHMHDCGAPECAAFAPDG